MPPVVIRWSANCASCSLLAHLWDPGTPQHTTAGREIELGGTQGHQRSRGTTSQEPRRRARALRTRPHVCGGQGAGGRVVARRICMGPGSGRAWGRPRKRGAAGRPTPGIRIAHGQGSILSPLQQAECTNLMSSKVFMNVRMFKGRGRHYAGHKAGCESRQHNSESSCAPFPSPSLFRYMCLHPLLCV